MNNIHEFEIDLIENNFETIYLKMRVNIIKKISALTLIVRIIFHYLFLIFLYRINLQLLNDNPTKIVNFKKYI